LKTALTNSQRRQLRDHVSAIGVSKSPELLMALSEIEDTDDFELLKACVVADIFDGKTPRQTSAFLLSHGICESDIARMIGVVLASAQPPCVVHGWN
jgi:hypothetical protein